MTVSRSKVLERRYREQNRGRGAGFVYGGYERVAALRSLMPLSPARVLDLGCRDGALARALALHAPIVGLDIDRDSLRRAHDDGALLACSADLWGELPVRTSSIELVIAGEVLEHLPFPTQLAGEIARVLAPGGTAIGSVPNSFRLKNRLSFLCGRWFEQDQTHLRHFSPLILSGLLREHFTDVEVVPAVGRYVRFWPRLLAVDLVWRASAPRGK